MRSDSNSRNIAAAVVRGDLPLDTAEQLLSDSLIAVDTETTGLNWASDRLALCQLHSPTVGTLLLQVDHNVFPKNLARVLVSTTTTKVFHFAPFDLRFIESTWGIRCENVLCTKAAHKILFPGISHREHSLSALTQAFLGVTLDKGTVRTSNWESQVLTDAQILYAAQDVEYLLPLLKSLQERLQLHGYTELFAAACSYMPVAAHFEISGIPDPLQY